MILKFKGEVTLVALGMSGGLTHIEVDLYVGDKKLIREVSEHEVEGKVYVDIAGERLVGEIDYSTEERTANVDGRLKVGDRDVIELLLEHEGREVIVWISERPFKAEQIWHLGYLYELREHWDLAYQYYSEASEADSGDAEYLLDTIEAAIMARKVQELGIETLFAMLDKATRLAPQNPRSYSIRAAMCEALGMDDEAATNREEAEEMHRVAVEATNRSLAKALLRELRDEY